MPTPLPRRQRPADARDSSRAWSMVVAAFIVGFVVFGVLYSFGAFFGPMAGEFHANRAATSAFFTITNCCFYLSGPITGRLSDRFGPRIAVGMGAVVMGSGLALTACIGDMWIGYLTYGIGVGLGAACAYIPTLAIVGGWFARHRNTAMGIAATGTGFGTLTIPPLAATLIQTYGWRVTDLVLGLGCFLLLGIAAAIVAPPPIASSPSGRPLRRTVLSPAFIVLYVSWVCATSALLVPLVFLPAFAREHGVEPIAASALLSLLGGMGILGRVGIGVLTVRVGTLRLFKISVAVMAVSYLLWLPFTTYGWLLTFVAVLGLGYGIRISLMPVVLIEVFGLENLGAVFGIFFTASAVSALVGPLLAGLIIDITGSYFWGIAFALALGTVGFAVVVPLKIHRGPQDDTDGITALPENGVRAR
jgi:MFS family permease